MTALVERARASYARLRYDALVPPGRRVAWYGAGQFAEWLMGVLDRASRRDILCIIDDAPRPSSGKDSMGAHPTGVDDGAAAIKGVPVLRPEDVEGEIDVVVLATDTHQTTLEARARRVFGPGALVVDLYAESRFTHAGASETAPLSGFFAQHPQRWREALGAAELLRDQWASCAPSLWEDVETRRWPTLRWAAAHTLLTEPRRALAVALSASEESAYRLALAGLGEIVSLDDAANEPADIAWVGAAAAGEDPSVVFERLCRRLAPGAPALLIGADIEGESASHTREAFHAHWRIDGETGESALLLRNAERDVHVHEPIRVRHALWAPHDDTAYHDALYAKNARGWKDYTVVFDDPDPPPGRGCGRVSVPVRITRERTYADARGWQELARYERIAAHATPGAMVLDCACGTGCGSSMLARRGARVVGADVSDEAVRFASLRYPECRFVCAPADDLPLPDSAFDLIACVETIEHVEGVEDALREFRRLLAPEGRLYLTTPAEDHCDSPYHVRGFTRDGLEAAIARVFPSDRWPRAWVPGERDSLAVLIRRGGES